MICPNCGKEIKDGEKFCSHCGAPANNQQNGSENQDFSGQNFNNRDENNNGYNQNGNNQNGYNQNGYNQNGYNQNGYNQNGYNQNGYNQNGYNQNGNFNNPYQNPMPNRPYIQKRNLAVCIILSLVTCGIYGIYWLICLVNDINTVSGHTNDTSGGMVFLLGLVTCNIYLFFWMYQAGGKIDQAKAMNGIPGGNDSGVLYLVLGVLGLGIVSYALMQNELNQIAEH